MMVSVKALVDITDDATGALVVPKGSDGEVMNQTTPPAPLRYQVQWSGGAVTYVDPSEVVFDEDGELGPVKVFFEGSGASLTEIAPVNVPATFDTDVPGWPHVDLSSVVMTWSDGRTLTIKANGTTGQLRFDIG